MRSFWNMYQHYVLSQTLKRQKKKKKNTKKEKKTAGSVNVFKPCGWKVSDFLAQSKQRPPLCVSPSHLFSPTLCSSSCNWRRRKGPAPPFLQARAPVNMQKPASLHRMTSKEPSVVKRNSRHSSHIQAISLQSSAPACMFLTHSEI